MEALVFGLVAALGFVAIVTLALWPSSLLWKLAQSVAYRVSGDDENHWVIIPAFVFMMLLIAGGDVLLTLHLRLGTLPDSDWRKVLAEGVAIYCGVAIVLAILGGLGRMFFAGCSAAFEGLNDAIRGD